MSTTIAKNIAGDLPASVQLITMQRRDTGAAATLSPGLPQSFTYGGVVGGDYTYAITVSDTAGDCPQGYLYTYQINWSDGTYAGPYTDLTPSGAGGAPTPAGPLSIAIGALQTLIANVPFFQTWVGAANATAALKNIFLGEVGYPIAAVTIASGVLTVQTRDQHTMAIGDVVTIQGASIGAESSIDLTGQWTITGVTSNTFTAATALGNEPTAYPDQAFVLDCVRPLAVICEASDGLHSESIGTGGTSIYAGSLDVLLEFDVSAVNQNNAGNALTEARNACGLFVEGLMETQDTGDLMVLNDAKLVSGPEFTAKPEQDQNSGRFERVRALVHVTWGLSG